MPIATQDVELEVSTSRLWQALKDSAVLFPKIAPQLFSTIEYIEGTEGSVGLVRLLKFGPVAPEGAFVKEKVIFLDAATMTVTTEEMEGGHLTQGFTKWTTTIKFTAIDDTKTKVDASFEYEGDNEAAVAQSKMGLVKLFQGVAGYIQSTGAYA